MQKIIEYRHKADECRALAASVVRAESRESLLALARSWERMADVRAKTVASGLPSQEPEEAQRSSVLVES